jgi:hypothetical protein
MKSKKVVRNFTKRHKSKILCIQSFGKYLITASEEVIIVYDYAIQEEACNISPNSQYDKFSCISGFKDSISQSDIILIGTQRGKIFIYNIDLKLYSEKINALNYKFNSIQL